MSILAIACLIFPAIVLSENSNYFEINNLEIINSTDSFESQNVHSAIECAVLCTQSAICLAANFKKKQGKPHICEMFTHAGFTNRVNSTELFIVKGKKKGSHLN